MPYSVASTNGIINVLGVPVSRKADGNISACLFHRFKATATATSTFPANTTSAPPIEVGEFSDTVCDATVRTPAIGGDELSCYSVEKASVPKEGGLGIRLAGMHEGDIDDGRAWWTTQKTAWEANGNLYGNAEVTGVLAANNIDVLAKNNIDFTMILSATRPQRMAQCEGNPDPCYPIWKRNCCPRHADSVRSGGALVHDPVVGDWYCDEGAVDGTRRYPDLKMKPYVYWKLERRAQRRLTEALLTPDIIQTTKNGVPGYGVVAPEWSAELTETYDTQQCRLGCPSREGRGCVIDMAESCTATKNLLGDALNGASAYECPAAGVDADWLCTDVVVSHSDAGTGAVQDSALTWTDYDPAWPKTVAVGQKAAAVHGVVMGGRTDEAGEATVYDGLPGKSPASATPDPDDEDDDDS